MENNDLIVHVSIGLLTFIAIFYTLVFSTASQTKLNDLKYRIREAIKEIDEHSEYMKSMTSNEKQLKKIENECKFDINIIKTLKILVQLDKILYICVMLFITSICYYILMNNLEIASLFFFYVRISVPIPHNHCMGVYISRKI